MKIITTQLLIFTLLTVSLRIPIFGQSQPVPSASAAAAELAEADLIKPSPDLKNVFARKTAEYNERAFKFDLKKAEKEERKQQTKKKFWNKTNTALMVLFIVGMAGLVFLVTKYYHKCIRTNYPGCDPVNDEGCVCEEYEKRVKD